MLDYKKIIGIIAGGIAGFLVLVFGIFGLIKLFSSSSNASTSDSGPAVSGPALETPEEIDLQLPVNQWVDSQASKDNSGIVIYDIDNSAVVARHNEDKVFDMAQLYQLFIAYEGYYRLARGNWEGDVAYESLKLNRRDCLDQMLRWSNVACSDAMWNEIGKNALQSVFSEKGFSATKISEFKSSASEILSLLQLYWNHPNFDDEIWQKIRVSLLEQGDNKTFDGQNLRQGLPSGFNLPTVYNKAGWYKTTSNGETVWHTYDDAAFVEFPEATSEDGATIPARHYIVVVLTHDTSPQAIVTLARSLESTIRTSDNY